MNVTLRDSVINNNGHSDISLSVISWSQKALVDYYNTCVVETLPLISYLPARLKLQMELLHKKPQ